MARTKKSTKVQKQIKIEEDNGNGIASLILGISSILLPILGIVTGILAIIFASKQKKIQPNTMATAGMITGIIGLVFQVVTLLAILFFIMLFGAVFSSMIAAGTVPV
ncbi:MAG: hypothetical protein ACP5N2_01665 [Candidatus Nanoarchaeia archaeon]